MMQPHMIEFFKATAAGQLSQMELLIQHGAENPSRNIDVETRDPDGLTPLLVACACRQAQAMEFLLSAGVNANMFVRDKNGSNALIFLVTKNAPLMLKRFLYILDLKQQQEANRNPAEGAAADSKQKLIDASDGHGLTALHAAAKSGLVHCANILLAHGAANSIDRPCQCPDSPLTAAVRNGDVTMAEVLIKKGKADIEFRSGKEGQSPLALAIINYLPDDYEMLDLLLSSGCKHEATSWHCNTGPGCCNYERLCEKTRKREVWSYIVRFDTRRREKEEAARKLEKEKEALQKQKQQQQSIVASLMSPAMIQKLDGVDWPFVCAVAVVLVVLFFWR